MAQGPVPLTPLSNAAKPAANDAPSLQEVAQAAADSDHASLLSTEGETFHVADALESEQGIGTIVTDHKQKRRSMFGVIRDAVDEWTTDKTETLKEMEVFKTAEPPKVAPGIKRKEIVAKAVSQEKHAPRDDHRVVLEHIKTFQQDAERASGTAFVVKKKTDETPKQWTHVGETATLKKAAPAPQAAPTANVETRAVPVSQHSAMPHAASRPVMPDVKEHTGKSIEDFTQKMERPDTPPGEMVAVGGGDIAPEVVEHSTWASAAPAPEPAVVRESMTNATIAPTVPVPEPRDTEAAIVTVTPAAASPLMETVPVPQAPEERVQIATPISDVPLPDPEPALPQLEEPTKATEESPRPVLPRDPVPRSRAAGSNATQVRQYPTGLLTIIITLVLSITLGGGYVVYRYMGNTPPVQPIEVGGPSLQFTPDEIVSTTFTYERHELIGNIMEALQEASGRLIRIEFTSDDGRLVGGGAFFTALDTRASGSLLRSLDNPLAVGGVVAGDMQPYIIVETDDFDTAFAGMLAWEATMNTDLAPLFETPTTRSADAATTSSPVIGSPRFVDRTVEGHHARILTDDTGAEYIAYTFLGRNTLMITSSRDALIELLFRAGFVRISSGAGN